MILIILIEFYSDFTHYGGGLNWPLELKKVNSLIFHKNDCNHDYEIIIVIIK